VAGLYFLAILSLTAIFVFKNGILFALGFLGTTMIPCIATVAAKWGIIRGDARQKLFVPAFALLLLWVAYWLSKSVSLDAGGIHLSGIALLAIGAIVGLVGVPLRWAE